MPCLQLLDQDKKDIELQIKRYRECNRFFALRIVRDQKEPNLGDAIDVLASQGTADFAVILEGRWTQDALK